MIGIQKRGGWIVFRDSAASMRSLHETFYRWATPKAERSWGHTSRHSWLPLATSGLALAAKERNPAVHDGGPAFQVRSLRPDIERQKVCPHGPQGLIRWVISHSIRTT
jgi:hypothetical protein